MQRLLLYFIVACSPLAVLAQNKSIQAADVHRWRKIDQTRLSNDGQWTAYTLNAVTEGDPTLCLWHAANGQTLRFPRGTDPRFSEDGRFLVFKIKPALDTLKALRRRKVKDDDLPKDSLGIYRLADANLSKIPQVKSFSLPDKWSDWLFLHLEAQNPKSEAKGKAETDKTSAQADTTKAVAKKDTKPKAKKEGKDNGAKLIVYHLPSGRQDTIPFVTSYAVAEKNPRLLWHTSGAGDLGKGVFKSDWPGVYWADLTQKQTRPLWRGKGKFQQLSLSQTGDQAAFLADTDTTKARIRPWQLMNWQSAALDSARAIAGTGAPFLQQLARDAQKNESWLISEHARPVFSEDGSKLYFGAAPAPVLNDTTLLPEEIVQVEVWAWQTPRLYTEMENRLENDKKRSYPVVFHTREKTFVALGSPELPEWRFQEQRDADRALAYTEEPYAHMVQWEGAAPKDLYAVDLKTGARQKIAQKLYCKPRLSPAAQYIAWWSEPDTAWFAWSFKTRAAAKIADNRTAAFYDEENDVPDYPDEYGLAGWLRNDEAVLLYDRFDLWKMDPEGKKAPQRLTNGRAAHTTYRYISLDPEERFIAPDSRVLLHFFHRDTKKEGYAWLDLKTNALAPWLEGEYAYARSPLKAKKAEALVFSRQNFQVFPDLLYVSLRERAEPRRVSDANPQQSEYRWGSIERTRWTSMTGETLEGLLVKPADFDPGKQYPMIVNFYERLSDGLYQHRSPDFHRSQINYTQYASQGYLVFAPDIPYRTGYPGDCAYDAIVSGVSHLMQKGFVDPKRIALQGHSWGGYQAAYVVTKTNMFACAEAGAPVVNMTSAYGGIRWETGLSRQFQYERQQSRIGGTLWDYPLRYLQNSPLFTMDKVETPLLILHNDKDGAVPWQQGIEMFTALRRLGKPAWMLNYNDEPHWPVKLQNRIDFQVRMQQFFDYFLKDAPQPSWMRRGVPPMEKGILQGLD